MARQERNSNRRKGSQPKGFKKEGKAPRPKYTPESSSNEQESTDFVYGRHAVREALQQPERVNKLWVQEALSGKEITPIIDLAKEQDALALIVIRHFSEYLGVACSHIANILNPSRIVIGGGVSAAGEFLLTGVREEFEKNVFPPIKDSTVLALAELGNDAGVIGAASLVLIGKS